MVYRISRIEQSKHARRVLLCRKFFNGRNMETKDLTWREVFPACSAKQLQQDRSYLYVTMNQTKIYQRLQKNKKLLQNARKGIRWLNLNGQRMEEESITSKIVCDEIQQENAKSIVIRLWYQMERYLHLLVLANSRRIYASPADWANRCLQQPRVYTLGMEVVSTIGQRPALLTTLEALETNCTICTVAGHSSSPYFNNMIETGKPVQFLQGNVRIWTATSLTLTWIQSQITVFMLWHEEPLNYADMDHNQQCYAKK